MFLSRGERDLGVAFQTQSHVLQTPIEVIQADSPAIVVGEEYTKKPLILVYVRYTCNFGAHYNSVKPQEAGAAGGAAPRLF